MSVRERSSGNVYLLETEKGDNNEIFHELIGAIRINCDLKIGAFERSYATISEACKVMDYLIEKGIFHAGTIRTHYKDGTVNLLGAWIKGEENKSGSLGKQIVGDMLAHIVGDKPVGSFITEQLFRGELAKQVVTGVLPN